MGYPARLDARMGKLWMQFTSASPGDYLTMGRIIREMGGTEGIRSEIPDGGGLSFTPLGIAVYEMKYELVKSLLEIDVDVRVMAQKKKSHYWHGLHSALRQYPGVEDSVRTFIRDTRGTDDINTIFTDDEVEIGKEKQFTALTVAAHEGLSYSAAILLQMGASMYTIPGDMPLVVAALYCSVSVPAQLEMMHTLFTRGDFDPHHRYGRLRYTLLHVVVSIPTFTQSCKELVRMCIEHKVPLDARDEHGMTAGEYLCKRTDIPEDIHKATLMEMGITVMGAKNANT